MEQAPADNSLLSGNQFSKFLDTLSIICNGDYENTESKEYKKAKLTFKFLQDKKCKVDEFDWLMSKFIKTHDSPYWFPSQFINLYEGEFGNDRMVY